MSNQAVFRLQKEYFDVSKNPDNAIQIWYDDKNITNCKAMIVGPPNTPYGYGQFEFSLSFPVNYPDAPPKVSALTTNLGRTRFNPNIYASGKVCLSILGTWRAESPGEQWSSAHGISSVLLSIQSLMSDKPYHNEPGFEDTKESKDTELIQAYNIKIQHETIRISVCDRLEHFLAIKRTADPVTIPRPYLPTSAFQMKSFPTAPPTITPSITPSSSAVALFAPAASPNFDPTEPAVTPPATSSDEPAPEGDDDDDDDDDDTTLVATGSAAVSAPIKYKSALSSGVVASSSAQLPVQQFPVQLSAQPPMQPPASSIPAAVTMGNFSMPGAMMSGGAFIAPRYASTHSIGPEFEDTSKRLFLCYYENYVETVKIEKEKVADGTTFKKMPFEGMGNTMDGSFNYTSLLNRLNRIQEALSAETRGWASDSARWVTEDTTTAANLKRQYEQAGEHFRDVTDATVQVSLVDENPFVWEVVVFGKPMTHYDGGLFRLQLLFSDRFPEVQPRARFLTPLYHPHVTESGVPWYRPARVDDVKSHVIALARLLDEDPSPDPIGHVNTAAARLCFGTKEERKEYGRNARRCANRSVEYNV